uniref:NACHT domain-containing protein n=1 Tax=Cyprinodon variegatus TaxID=28743 RepID=A0A3Q2E3G4_CYPVA
KKSEVTSSPTAQLHQTQLDSIFMVLLSQGHNNTEKVNDEHEVSQIETVSRKTYKPETTIRQEDIFKVPPGRDQPIRTILTQGVAGTGKTVLTRKFTLDWAQGNTRQNIQFIFPFTFRELNVLKEKKFSLVELVHHFFTETKEISSFEDFRVLIILDGLDESRLPLDFTKKKILTDCTESTSMDALLINLIRGKLLPSALLWITTRPAAANQIPPECVGMVTEVRGFSGPQKDEYFKKRFRDEEQASRIIAHMKKSKSIHIMCHIPVFCWITATVLGDVLKTKEGGELPNTLTEMYIHFLVVQTKVKRVKYDGGAETDQHWSPESRKMIESLGKLAFNQLQKGNLIFYESDLTEAFINSGVSLMEDTKSSKKYLLSKKPNLKLLHQKAVDQALQSPNGHLDLFLRFLLGLSLHNNQRLLQGLLTHTGSHSQTNQETVQYIKEKISGNVSAERNINLFHCLNELNDHSLVEEIQQSLSSGNISIDKLSPAQWSALGFILVSSGDTLNVFDLKKYSASEGVLLRLSGCNLSKRSYKALSLVLSNQSSSLRELDLSNNKLQDSGVKLLRDGLESLNSTVKDHVHYNIEFSTCHVLRIPYKNKLQNNLDGWIFNCIIKGFCAFLLRLSVCSLSERSCEDLSSVLSSQSSSLLKLDLSNNDLQNLGVKLLSAGLESPNCKLEILSLSGCLISEEGCVSLASALSSNTSHLKELDLSYNHLGDLGVKQLLAGVRDPCWRLQILRYG